MPPSAGRVGGWTTKSGSELDPLRSSWFGQLTSRQTVGASQVAVATRDWSGGPIEIMLKLRVASEIGTVRLTASLIVMTHSHEPPGEELTSRPGPPFCAQCGKPVSDDPWLISCPICGDRLLSQGYCPVCEDYWRLPVGTACPKHDLPLDANGPASPRLDAGDKPFRWVTVGRFGDSLAAEAPRIRLEAEGIPTFVEGQRMGSRSMYHVAIGGVRLKVPDNLAGDARIILSQTWSATAAELGIEEDHDEGAEDFQAELPPEVQANGRSLRSEVLFFLIVGLPGLSALLSLAAALEQPLRRVEVGLRSCGLRAGGPARGP